MLLICFDITIKLGKTDWSSWTSLDGIFWRCIDSDNNVILSKRTLHMMWCHVMSQVFSEGHRQQGKAILDAYDKMQNAQLGKCNKSNV